MKMGTKRKPTYKQMAFETAVRNPERYIGLLKALKSFEGQVLNDKILLALNCTIIFLDCKPNFIPFVEISNTSFFFQRD